MFLRAVQASTGGIGSFLTARVRISSAPLLRLQAAGRPAHASRWASRALPERPAEKTLSYWTIAFAGMFMGTLTGGYERLLRSIIPMIEAMPAGPPEMEPPQLINAMINLKENPNMAKDLVHLAALCERYKPDPRSGDPKSVYFYLGIHMSLLHAALLPLKKFERFFQEVLFEIALILPVSWVPLRIAVFRAQDPIATELLQRAEAEIHAIRTSACMDISNLLQSDEVKTGRMKPIDVVKAMVESLQKAHFNALSTIFSPVHERLAVVREERTARAERAKEATASEENGSSHTVLG